MANQTFMMILVVCLAVSHKPASAEQPQKPESPARCVTPSAEGKECVKVSDNDNLNGGGNGGGTPTPDPKPDDKKAGEQKK